MLGCGRSFLDLTALRSFIVFPRFRGGSVMPLDPALKEVLLQFAAAPQANGLDEMRQAVVANAARTPKRSFTGVATRDLTIPGPASVLPARLL